MSVQSILDRNYVRVEIGATTYTMRRASALLLARALGSGFLGMVDGADDSPAKVAGHLQAYLKNADQAEKVLRLAMVSPRLGDVADDAKDIVAMLDLRDEWEQLLAAVMAKDVQDAADFPKPSEVQEG